MPDAAGTQLSLAIASEVNNCPLPRVTCSEHVTYGSSPMHTISDLLTTFSGTASLPWQPWALNDTGREIADTIARIKNQMHRDLFSKGTDSTTLETIDSPAIAACILFHRLADENPRERVHARELILERLEGIVPEAQRDEVMVYSAWVADQLVDPREPMRHFRQLWFTRLTHDERADLVAIAEEVTWANGRPTEQQLKAMKMLRCALGA